MTASARHTAPGEATARPAGRRSTPTAPTSVRAEHIAAFYAQHANRLHRTVAANVNAPEQTIEDACQNGWTVLMCRDDIALDHHGAAWLATVAIREGWRLASTAREVPMGAMRPASPRPASCPNRQPRSPGPTNRRSRTRSTPSASPT